MGVAISMDASQLVDGMLFITGLLTDEDVKLEINQLFAELADPYVPYRTGALANNIDVTSQGITYKQPYAEEVYMEDVPHNPAHHPLATDHWGEAMLRDRNDEFVSGVAQIMARRLKERGR